MTRAGEVLRQLEHADQNDAPAYWRFATCLAARHAPRDAHEFSSFEIDLRVILRMHFVHRFDAPDDDQVGERIDELLVYVRTVALTLAPWPRWRA
jgi:hypothetical protein